MAYYLTYNEKYQLLIDMDGVKVEYRDAIFKGAEKTETSETSPLTTSDLYKHPSVSAQFDLPDGEKLVVQVSDPSVTYTPQKVADSPPLQTSEDNGPKGKGR